MTLLEEVKAIYENELEEQAQAMKGDWKDGAFFLEEISEFGFHNDYVIINKNFKIPPIQGISSLIFIKNKKYEIYKLGQMVEREIENKLGKQIEKKFEVFFIIDFEPKKLKGYNNCYSVSGVAVNDKLATKNGLATFMYKYFVKEMKYTIVGDSQQYFGARKLWAKLSKELDLKVDIYDTEKQEVLFENVILHHGNYNGDFDERLWSYSKSKIHLRSILTEILD